MGAETKERIVGAGATLFRRQGYAGTGIKEIVERASAPFSSLYHFFPGGKEQLGAEVIHSSGQTFQDLVMAVLDAVDDLPGGVEACFAGAAETLRQTDYADACPIATVALEVASTNETLREATAEVFERWIAAATERAEAGGVPQPHARELAIALICLLEGAFILSRAARTPEALHAAGRIATDAAHAAATQAQRASTESGENLNHR